MNAIHAWLAARPIARELIFGTFFVVMAYYVTPLLTTSKRFLAIPPQRLSLRILKARLSYAEANLENFYALRDNLRYFISTCTEAILTMVMSASLLCIAVEILPQLTRSGPLDHVQRFMLILFRYFAAPYSLLLFLYTVRSMLRVAGAIKPGRYYERLLKAKRNHLKMKLLDRGVSE